MVSAVSNLIFSRCVNFGKNAKASIFYFNDLHGELEGLDRLNSAAKNFDRFEGTRKDTDTIKVQSGDVTAGVNKKLGELIIDGMNSLGITAANLGNHEFDMKTHDLASLLKKLKSAVLSTNLQVKDSSPLKPILSKSFVKEINDTEYGFMGIQPYELKSVVKKNQGIDEVEVENFEKTAETVNEEAKRLKGQGVERIILLSHTGFSNDKKLAPKLKNVDVIISGHTHNVIDGIVEGQNLFYNEDGEPVVIVQAGRDGKHYGILNLEFDDKGIIKTASNSVEKTEQAESLLMQFKEDLFLGKSPVVGKISYIEKAPKRRLIEPNAYAHFIADAVRDELGVDMVFINPANIRRMPKEGHITERVIQNSTPFKNDMIETAMTEKEIVEGLKFASKSMTNPDNKPGIMQVSGLKYAIDRQGNLKNLEFVDKTGKSYPINLENPSTTKTYTCAFDSFIADGREYSPFKRYENQITKHHDFDKDTLLINWFKKRNEPVEIRHDDRIKIENT